MLVSRNARGLGRWIAVLTMSVVVTLVVACSGGGDGGKKQTGNEPSSNSIAATEEPRAAATVEATATPEEAAVPTPAAPKFPEPNADATLARLMLPNWKISAPVQEKGVNARNEMENPDGKDNVAWYRFTARPGFGSNAVFSGHVDWFTKEQGVFWHLRDMKQGDEVVIKLSDGTELKYQVVENTVYESDKAPVADIIGPTDKELVTLITCEGVFDTRSQDYNKRRVVRAERVG